MKKLVISKGVMVTATLAHWFGFLAVAALAVLAASAVVHTITDPDYVQLWMIGIVLVAVHVLLLLTWYQIMFNAHYRAITKMETKSAIQRANGEDV